MSRPIYVLVTERDMHDPFESKGAIVHEQYTRCASLEEIKARRAKFGGIYGQTWICRLIPLEDEEI